MAKTGNAKFLNHNENVFNQYGALQGFISAKQKNVGEANIPRLKHTVPYIWNHFKTFVIKK